MFIGQTLVVQKIGTNSYPTTMYTPWFARGGDEGVFTMEVLALSQYMASTSDAQIKMTIETKKADEGDSGADPVGNTYITAQNDGGSVPVTVTVNSSAGLLELVRLKIELSETESDTTTMVFSVARVLAPQWVTN
jgi:hypothetical protein